MLLRDRLRFATVALVLLLSTRPVDAQETKPEGGEEAKPATVKATAGPFTITVDLKGTLQPERVATIAVDPAELTALKVVELVDQGTVVRKGDVVLKLDTDTVDKQIRALEFAVRLAELSLEQGKHELAILEKTAPLDMELAKRSNAQAQEDLAYFLETEMDLTKEQARRSVESAEFQLEYSNEELQQLKKMYEEDDLTEETEEMILRRTERSVESAQHYLDLARIRSKKLLETSLPRQEIEARDAAVRAELALRRASATTPLAVDRKKVEMTKQRYDLEETLEKLEALRADRALLEVKSPVDGVVYHGTWNDGTWTLSSTVKAALKVGGSLPVRTPVVAIVAPQPLSILTTVEEKDVALVHNGATGHATPTAFPNSKLPVKVAGVSRFPSEPGKFTTKLSLGPKPIPELVPGMTVAIKLTAYNRKKAVTVPATAVFEEGDEKVVYLAEGDTATRRVVKTGRSHDGRTEILEGLSAGDEIRAAKP